MVRTHASTPEDQSCCRVRLVPCFDSLEDVVGLLHVRRIKVKNEFATSEEDGADRGEQFINLRSRCIIPASNTIGMIGIVEGEEADVLLCVASRRIRVR